MRWAALLAVFSASACQTDFEANPAPRCDDGGVCPQGSVCHRGFCVAEVGARCEVEGGSTACYTGPAGTAGVGACRPGARVCRDGSFGACLDEILPGIEICNEIDDDCDGRIDETSSEECDTGLSGACRAGLFRCAGVAATCVPVREPTAETCNGVDDDCDGAIDEGAEVSCYPEGVRGCTFDDDGMAECVGSCAPGVRRCIDGALGACEEARVPSTEPDVCTPHDRLAADEDCDGETDEDCSCLIGWAQPCYGGPPGTEGVGICRQGVQRCEMTEGGTYRFGACEGAQLPGIERCTNLGTDDDCDGVVDEGLVERCDGTDDDCDGEIDEGFDLMGDEMNCGACGRVCDGDKWCEGGCCCNRGRCFC